jgi:hypothetical protein
MREIIERFAGRYQIWRDDVRSERVGSDKNPYVFFAVVAAVFLAWDIYKLATGHRLPWSAIPANAWFVVFIVFCVWRPKWAWVVFLLAGATMIMESPWLYTLDRSRYPARVRFVGAAFYAGLGAIVLAWGFVMRRRYERYLRYRHRADDEGV